MHGNGMAWPLLCTITVKAVSGQSFLYYTYTHVMLPIPIPMTLVLQKTCTHILCVCAFSPEVESIFHIFSLLYITTEKVFVTNYASLTRLLVSYQSSL